ncbi:hypothetical protein LWI29_025050 [Acer saccharum]|uniref:RNase H type-1 domain-containing protein n=1 Tax=Acer saccharum TaxID=4024 RepID=A0AA39S8G7_ACESA|nr:hypothetical protein LWI29_025050 [Acer saccharum]
MWLRTVSPCKKTHGRYGRMKNLTRGNYIGSNHAKMNQTNQRRFHDNWRNPIDYISIGNSGDRKYTNLLSSGKEKGKGQLASKSCIKNSANDGNISSRGRENDDATNIDTGGSNEEYKGIGKLGGRGGKFHNAHVDEVDSTIDMGKEVGIQTRCSNKELGLTEPISKVLDSTQLSGLHACQPELSKDMKSDGPKSAGLSLENTNSHHWRRVGRKSNPQEKQNVLGIELGKRSGYCPVNDLRSIKKKARVSQNEDDGLVNKNDRLHNGIKGDVSNVVWWSRNYLDELHRFSSKGGPAISKEGERWWPPGYGELKVNCNAALDKGKRRIGFGSVIRNSEGRVLACCAQACDANFDMETTKAIAVYKALKFCSDCGWSSCIVESDSVNVFNNIVKEGPLDSRYGSVLNSINLLISNRGKVLFNYVSAKANRVAGALAIEALGNSEDVFWKDDAPMCIKRLLEEDLRF